jgi:glycosyltransferase involved in cell wall biosynthesis
MSGLTRHITVCICTFKRQLLLKRLLMELQNQDTQGLFTYSIIVVDNDQSGSAESVASEFRSTSSIALKYCVEPRQNIPHARNKAIENAEGDFVAFIDDDEFPANDWLLTLFNACNQHHVSGVLGPVKPYFDDKPPRWVVEGRFYERATYSTGSLIDWRHGLTCNVLLKRQIFEAGEQPFRPEFRTGEDQDFFHRMIKKGHVFIWSNEAVVYEVVPPVRWTRRFMLKRALLRGSTFLRHPSFGRIEIAKSLIAVPVYIIALPFALAVRHCWFMTLMVKLFQHIGRLLALLGINPITQPYVTE